MTQDAEKGSSRSGLHATKDDRIPEAKMLQVGKNLNYSTNSLLGRIYSSDNTNQNHKNKEHQKISIPIYRTSFRPRDSEVRKYPSTRS